MNKKTALLSGFLAIFGVIATVGIIASSESNSGMMTKQISEMPENRSEYLMTDQELEDLENQLKADEAAPAMEEFSEESIEEDMTPEQ